MKAFKKALATALIITMAISVLSISAFASNYENCAEDLNALGLFMGTGSGYDLDSVPTRVQAGIMLIRLLGKEDAAKASNYTHPFKDVPEWADKYVGYLYGTGLTKGVSDTLFGTDDPCQVGMYVTFVLRALGYDDSKGDFQYSQAVDFGAIIGVVDYSLAAGTFLRDEMVAISLLALNTQPKDKSVPTLLNKLVNDGAVSAAAAKPILDRFAAYDAHMEAAYGYASESRIYTDLVTEVEVTAFGQTIPQKQTASVKASFENNYLLMAITTRTEVMGITGTAEMYYRDGYLYVNENGAKDRITMDPEDAFLIVSDAYATFSDLYSVESITKTASGVNTVYKITYTDSFVKEVSDGFISQDIIRELLSPGDTRSASVNDISLEVVVDSAGRLVSQKTFMDMSLPVTVNGIKTMAACKYVITMTVRATGSSVVINFPSDLGSYLPVG